MRDAKKDKVNNLNTFLELTKRNMLLFLKNRMTVIFSLLAPLLLLVFFVLFMSDMQVSLITGMLEVEVDTKIVQNIVNSWMISGVVSIACLTVALNSMLVIIADKEKKTVNDFTASPVRPIVLICSYFASSFILTFSLCLIVLIGGMIFITAASGIFFTFSEIMELLLILFLSCLSADIFMLCIMSNFKSGAASAAFSGVFSALIGFITGAYIPMSMIPLGVQNFANLIPGSHSTGLFRNLFVNKALSALPDTIPTEFLDSINQNYSLDLNLFGAQLTRTEMFIYLTASIVVLFVLYIIIDRLQKKFKK